MKQTILITVGTARAGQRLLGQLQLTFETVWTGAKDEPSMSLGEVAACVEPIRSSVKYALDNKMPDGVTALHVVTVGDGQAPPLTMPQARDIYNLAGQVLDQLKKADDMEAPAYEREAAKQEARMLAGAVRAFAANVAKGVTR